MLALHQILNDGHAHVGEISPNHLFYFFPSFINREQQKCGSNFIIFIVYFIMHDYMLCKFYGVELLSTAWSHISVLST